MVDNDAVLALLAELYRTVRNLSAENQRLNEELAALRADAAAAAEPTPEAR